MSSQERCVSYFTQDVFALPVTFLHVGRDRLILPARNREGKHESTFRSTILS